MVIKILVPSLIKLHYKIGLWPDFSKNFFSDFELTRRLKSLTTDSFGTRIINAGLVLEKDKLFCSLAGLWCSGPAVKQSDGLSEDDKVKAAGDLVAAVDVSASSK